MNARHALALGQLSEIADASEGSVEVLDFRTNDSGTFLLVDITIRFEGVERSDDGIPIRAREAFCVAVGEKFPYSSPSVRTHHTRFASYPHVQWNRSLCLYQGSSDWRPDDGMYGFVSRLDRWMRDAALGNLDPADAPLHPPVAYATVSRLVVPRADTPSPGATCWIGYAGLRERGSRTEIIEWREIEDGIPDAFAPALLLNQKFPFEYPATVDALINEFKGQGIDFAPLIRLLAVNANLTPRGTPLLVVLGTPMRRIDPGTALQHLAAWEIDAEAADRLRDMRLDAASDAAHEETIRAVVRWSIEAKVGWCRVREMREEVTRRRDEGSAMSWFRGKRVAIWGCGAIGTHVADSIARARAARIHLVDNGLVTPGILVRQSFEDDDIGKTKADALAARIKRIDPDIEVIPVPRDLIDVLDEEDPFGDIDIVLDCTASQPVRLMLEAALLGRKERPLTASLAISHDACAAMATLSNPEHSGGPLDLIRRLRLEACRNSRLWELRDAFWPKTPRTERFQPEPGCSDATFVGSDADLAALSARMLNAIASWLRCPPAIDATAGGWLFHTGGAINSFSWKPDYALGERTGGYQVRVSSHAIREMKAWARRSGRVVGPKTETGGLIFGEINETARILWVTEVEGPPPDSEASEQRFTCGVEGMKEAAEEKEARFGGAVRCIGSWHTHPNSSPHPSDVDLGAVAQLLGAPESTRRTCLLLILAGNPDNPVLGAHAFRTRLTTEKTLHVDFNTASDAHIGTDVKTQHNIGLALSGGGSRAIAFHLGCLRALDDLGLLSRLQVVSSVSGGSVLAAMYAYSGDEFAKFDARVSALLRRGLTRDIARAFLTPRALAKAAWYLTTAYSAGIARAFFRLIPDSRTPGVFDANRPPPMRLYSRTEAFRDALATGLFGNLCMDDVARESLQTIINATELRTGSAFRFGSRESRCWRFGTIPKSDALVADAVASSAAYPLALPALDRVYNFESRSGERKTERVLLTDGGVYENLGVSPLEPGRHPSIASNAYAPDYIVACDAGSGLLDADSFATRWPARMKRTFLATFRKVQDATRNRLHALAESGDISGFVLAYLGQQDRSLPWKPPALPSREAVYLYPTDFSPMDQNNIDRLALRGELLTRFLIAYYLPDL